MNPKIFRCGNGNSVDSYFLFIREYFKNIKRIGSLVPDSRFCVERLLSHINFQNVRFIVEWGAGSGAVTRAILERMVSSSFLVSFETNPNFFQQLRIISDPKCKIVQSDAWNSVPILSAFGFGQADCVISTLPASNIPDYDSLVSNVLKYILAPHGIFVQYLHVISVLKGFRLGQILATHFQKIHRDFTMFNIPPVWIHSCWFKK